MSGNERVILIKGNNSKWYEQAIFIVKESMLETNVPVDLVNEAEKIIANYIDRARLKVAQEKTPPPFPTQPKKSSQVTTMQNTKKNKTLDVVLNLILLASLLTIIGALMFGLS